jgi:hypothetical protein
MPLISAVVSSSIRAGSVHDSGDCAACAVSAHNTTATNAHSAARSSMRPALAVVPPDIGAATIHTGHGLRATCSGNGPLEGRLC